MNQKEHTTRACTCNKCFYCYINQDFFHTPNLEKLRLTPLAINISEYVGPEVTAPKEEKHKTLLEKIPIKLCQSGHNE